MFAIQIRDGKMAAAGRLDHHHTAVQFLFLLFYIPQSENFIIQLKFEMEKKKCEIPVLTSA